MKSLLFSLFLLAAAAGLGWIAWRSPDPDYTAPHQVPTHISVATPPGFVVRTFEVEGMCCASCPPRIEEAAQRIEGVQAFAARLGEEAVGEVDLLVPADLDSAALEAALTFDRYVAHLAPRSGGESTP